MDMKELSIGRVLDEYLPTVKDGEMRDAIVASVMKSATIEKAFSTPQGKLILEGAINLIQKELIGIIDDCKVIKMNNSTPVSITARATNINIIIGLMEQWATIYYSGKNILEQAKITKKR